MPNGMQGFINTFFQAQNLKMQRQQQALMEQNSLAERARIATEIGQLMTSPEGREQVSHLIGDPEIGQFIQDLAPGVGVLQRLTAQAGLESADPEQRGELEEVAAARETTGMDPGQIAASQFQAQLLGQPIEEDFFSELARQAQTRTATGMTAGQLSFDQAIERLPPEEKDAAVRVREGLELSEMEANQVAQWAAQNGIQWADLEQRGALGTAGLMARVWEVTQMASGQASPFGDLSPNQMWTQIGQALSAIDSGPDTPQEHQLQAVRFNTALTTLMQMGLAPPNSPLMSMDPDELRPGWFKKFKFWGWGAGGDVPEINELDPFGMLTNPSQLLSNQGMSAEELLEMIRGMGVLRDE